MANFSKLIEKKADAAQYMVDEITLHKKERKAQNGAPHKASNKKRGGEGGYDYSRFSK